LLAKHDKSRNIIVECISHHAAPSGNGTESKIAFSFTPYLFDAL